MHNVNGFLSVQAAKFSLFWPESLPISALEVELNEVFFDDSASTTRYESEQMKVREGDRVIDLYGGIPVFSAYALSKGAHVLAIEPNRELCHALCYSFHEEIVAGRLTVLHGRVGVDKAAQQPTRSQQELPLQHGSGEAPIYSFDELFSRKITSAVSLLRINSVELAMTCLESADTTLQTQKPKLAIRMRKGESIDLVLTLLEKMGVSYSIQQQDYETFSTAMLTPKP